MEDRWSQYRALLSDGGFLYNDSFIVVNDYDQSLDETNFDIDGFLVDGVDSLLVDGVSPARIQMDMGREHHCW